MADEPKTETTETSQVKEGKVVFESQADFDAVVERRLARERQKFADYDETKVKLEKLTQEQKEREERELTEAERLKKQNEEINKKLEEIISERDTYKQFKTDWEDRENAEIEDLSKSLTDKQKDIISKLPLHERRSAISEFAATKPNPGHWGKQTETGIPSPAELAELRVRYGPSSREYISALNRRMGK